MSDYTGYPQRASTKEDLQKEWQWLKEEYERWKNTQNLIYRINERVFDFEIPPQELIPFEKNLNNYENEQAYFRLNYPIITKHNIDELFEITKTVGEYDVEEFMDALKFDHFGNLEEVEMEEEYEFLFRSSSSPGTRIFQNEDNPTELAYDIILAHGGPNEWIRYWFHLEEDNPRELDCEKEQPWMIEFSYSWWSPTITIDITDDRVAQEWYHDELYHWQEIEMELESYDTIEDLKQEENKWKH